jgi:mannose-6-phosphate isomerase-like protein (cupin superfamily)
MKIVSCWEEEGVTIPEPFKRNIKVIFGPDKNDVPELLFSIAIIYPGFSTDYHKHDRIELIYIVSGRGIAVCEGKEIPVETDMALLAEIDEMHQMKNTGVETLKLATIFVPPYTGQENLNRCFVNAAKAASEGK